MVHTVLIVDDDLEIRENYCDLLNEHGFNVHDCATAENALIKFKYTTYDLVVLDISMYGDKHAGHRLCREMKEFKNDVPVAMLTSSDDESDKNEADSSDADRYWIKSSDYMHFVNNVKQLLRAL